MVNEKPLLSIEEMINIIYSPEQKELDAAFINILDAFMGMIEEITAMGYMVDMTKELTMLQNAYIKKDYIELADILLYNIKPELQEISL